MSRPTPYSGAGDAARQRVADLSDAWKGDPDGTLRRRFLARPLTCTSEETRILSTAGADMPERLADEMDVRAILLAMELSIDPFDPDWREVLAQRLLAGTLRGGVGWFLKRKAAGRKPAFPTAVLNEAERLLMTVKPGYGARARALRPLLDLEGIPADRARAYVETLLEAIRQKNRRQKQPG